MKKSEGRFYCNNCHKYFFYHHELHDHRCKIITDESIFEIDKCQIISKKKVKLKLFRNKYLNMMILCLIKYYFIK